MTPDRRRISVRRVLWVCSLLALALLPAERSIAAPRGEATYYVRIGGSDQADGLSPQAALASLQAAVNHCTGQGNIIYVGPGTYHEEVHVGVGAGAAAPDGSAMKPNRIVGDVNGVFTGDAAGPVIVNGDQSRQYGVRFGNCDHWTLENLSLSGQLYYGVYGAQADGLEISACTLDAPLYYAMYLYGSDITVQGNTINRQPGATSYYGILAYSTGGTTTISRNRLVRTGDDYLTNGYSYGWMGDNSSGGYGSGGQNSTTSYYGIFVLAFQNGQREVRVENNVISDSMYGIFAYAYNVKDEVVVACNTISGTYCGLYGYTYKGSLTLADNIVTDSYLAALCYRSQGSATVSGLLVHNIQSPNPVQSSGATVTGVISGDPAWTNPAAGDFTLTASSSAIDAGLGAGSTTSDYMGTSRPLNGDGLAGSEYDLGAFEFDPNATPTPPRILRWVEVGSD